MPVNQDTVHCIKKLSSQAGTRLYRGQSRLERRVRAMTDEKLTALYNKANRLDPKRHNPITTERIFAAMREAILAERMEAELRCADCLRRGEGEEYVLGITKGE